MFYSILFIGVLLTGAHKDSCHGKSDKNLNSIVYEWAEKDPVFPSGSSGLITFIHAYLVYPEWDMENILQTRSDISFVVTETGGIVDIRVANKQPADYTPFDKECLRVVGMMPDWVPGECDGKQVAVRYVLPIQVEVK